MSNTPKWILEACADPERNPHKLKPSTISSRFYRQGQGKHKSGWGKWEPGKFSAADKERRA
jgi:hypothetical protein